jgi:hypothetical protein
MDVRCSSCRAAGVACLLGGSRSRCIRCSHKHISCDRVLVLRSLLASLDDRLHNTICEFGLVLRSMLTLQSRFIDLQTDLSVLSNHALSILDFQTVTRSPPRYPMLPTPSFSSASSASSSPRSGPSTPALSPSNSSWVVRSNLFLVMIYC